MKFETKFLWLWLTIDSNFKQIRWKTSEKKPKNYLWYINFANKPFWNQCTVFQKHSKGMTKPIFDFLVEHFFEHYYTFKEQKKSIFQDLAFLSTSTGTFKITGLVSSKWNWWIYVVKFGKFAWWLWGNTP